MNLGLKYCSLSLLDWNTWSTISGTITSVLFEAPGLNLDSVHTEWKIKWETITAWWLPLWELLESHREKREFALPNSWVAKPIVGGLGKNLIFSLSGLSFFFDAWVELFHPTKGRLRLHSQRVELHITPSLLWSYVSKSQESIEAATYKGERVPWIAKLRWSCASSFTVWASFCSIVKWE